VQFLIAGQRAGQGSDVTIPDPAGERNVEEREGLTVVRLSRLIEMKIACGMSNLRRTHKDFADVVELIAARNLDESFARYIHKSLRAAFRELVRNAQATG
jgi:RNase P/RNase MRP subunit p30